MPTLRKKMREFKREFSYKINLEEVENKSSEKKGKKVSFRKDDDFIPFRKR